MKEMLSFLMKAHKWTPVDQTMSEGVMMQNDYLVSLVGIPSLKSLNQVQVFLFSLVSHWGPS